MFHENLKLEGAHSLNDMLDWAQPYINHEEITHINQLKETIIKLPKEKIGVPNNYDMNNFNLNGITDGSKWRGKPIIVHDTSMFKNQ